MVKMKVAADFDTLWKFNLFDAFKTNKRWVLFASPIFLGLIGILIFAEHFIVPESIPLEAAIGPLTFALLFIPLVLLLTYLMIKGTAKRNLFMGQSGIVLFDDEVFTYATDKDGISTLNKIAYDTLFRIYEDKNYYFLYINAMQGIPMRKEGLTAEDEQYISARLCAVKNRKTA
jgi:hypothetical protein